MISSPTVYAPESLSELHSLLAANPDASLFAGGTWLMARQPEPRPVLPETLISLKRIEELSRITRSERFLEVGSMVTISHLLETGRNVLPPFLGEVLSRIGLPGIRNLATLGGNLCVPDRRMSGYGVLAVMDARAELRSGSASRWVPVSRLADAAGRLDIRPGEVLTRVRIPFQNWSVQLVRSQGSAIVDSDAVLLFCGLAQTGRGLLSDFRFIFSYPRVTILRRREIEAQIVGRKLPLSKREIDPVIDGIRQALDRTPDKLSVYQREKTLSMLRWFLSQLREE